MIAGRREAAAAGARVDAEPALADRQRADPQQAPRLGQQQLVDALLSKRRWGVVVDVAVADDQVALRELSDNQVDARVEQLGALRSKALAHPLGAGLRGERRVADRAEAREQR